MKILIVCLLLLAVAGCSTTNGFFRDVRSVSEYGIKATQKAVDTQRDGSIAFSIQEQNNIVKRGTKMLLALDGQDMSITQP